MIPLLIFAAGAAALEIKRLTNRPQGAEQTEALLEKERHLHQVLQVVLQAVLIDRILLILHACESLTWEPPRCPDCSIYGGPSWPLDCLQSGCTWKHRHRNQMSLK